MVDQTVAYFSVHPAQLTAVGTDGGARRGGPLVRAGASPAGDPDHDPLRARHRVRHARVLPRVQHRHARPDVRSACSSSPCSPSSSWQAIKQLEPMPEPRGGRAKALFSRKLR